MPVPAILRSDRGTRKWTTCLRLLRSGARTGVEPATSRSLVRLSIPVAPLRHPYLQSCVQLINQTCLIRVRTWSENWTSLKCPVFLRTSTFTYCLTNRIPVCDQLCLKCPGSSLNSVKYLSAVWLLQPGMDYMLTQDFSDYWYSVWFSFWFIF